MSRFGFEQDENGPFLWMSINCGEDVTRLRMDWETTAMFTHREQDKHYDHIFVSMEEDAIYDEDSMRSMGAFIWRQVLPDWDDLARGLIVHDFQHIHSPYPSPQDVEQYERSGLVPPNNFIKPIVAIEEVEDEKIAQEAVAHIDEEWDYWDKEWNSGS